MPNPYRRFVGEVSEGEIQMNVMWTVKEEDYCCVWLGERLRDIGIVRVVKYFAAVRKVSIQWANRIKIMI